MDEEGRNKLSMNMKNNNGRSRSGSNGRSGKNMGGGRSRSESRRDSHVALDLLNPYEDGDAIFKR